MSNTNVKNDTGLNFGDILALIFITLKLCNVIDWSWWWVLSPVWLTAIVVVGVKILNNNE